MPLFFKWEVVIFMLNKKGMSLVETLCAFSLFMVLALSLIQLMNISFNQEKRLTQLYIQLQNKEVDFVSLGTLEERLAKALH